MKRALHLAIGVLLILPSPAGAGINSRYQENCGSCHLGEPEAGENGKTDYNFLAEDIDPTCMTCHVQKCCTIARPHQTTHPSGIDSRDRQKYSQPRTLPPSTAP